MGIAKVAGSTLAATLLVGALAGTSSVSARTAGVRASRAARAAQLSGGKRAFSVPRSVGAAPPLYQVVNSGSLAAPTGLQATGDVACPTGTVVYGGGVFIASSSLPALVSSSWPEDNTHWGGVVNNGSASDTTFEVFATCAKQTRAWKILMSDQVENFPNSQVQDVYIACPAGTKALGGGGLGSGTLGQSINTSEPTKSGSGTSAVYGWRLDESNASNTYSTAQAYVVCGNARGYHQYSGTAVPNPAGTETHVSLNCPSPKVPLSGGVFSNNGSPLSGLNGTAPFATRLGALGWGSWENNSSSFSGTVTPYLVCAGT